MTLWSGILDSNFELESSKFFEYDSKNYRVRRNTFATLDYKEGSLIYWYQGSSAIHILYLSKQNTVERYKIIADLGASMTANNKPNVEILKNDDILISVPLDFGRKLALYRLDAQWQNVESFGYEIENEPSVFEDNSSLFSTVLRADQASVLTQDGILANFYTNGREIDISNFYLLPLDLSLIHI